MEEIIHSFKTKSPFFLSIDNLKRKKFRETKSKSEGNRTFAIQGKSATLASILQVSRKKKLRVEFLRMWKRIDKKKT